MANRTVRASLPINDTDEFIKVVEGMIARHEDDPAISKLDNDDVAELKALLEAAKPFRDTAKKLREQAQAAQEKFRLALGTGKGQTSKTKGTCYNLANRMRKQLLLAFEGEEEQISTYGLKVVIGTAKPRGPRKPKPTM